MFTDHQLRTRDIDTLKRWLRFRLGGYVVAVKHITAPSMVYRGVACAMRPESVSQISYPPADRVLALQRLNREGQPRFYCTVAPPAVFFELHAQKGDFIALSEWEVTEPLWMHNLGYHPRALQRIGAQQQSVVMRHAVTHAIRNETRQNEKLHHQLSEAFTCDVRVGEEYRYKQSIAIIESMSENVELQFPSHGGSEMPKRNKIAGTVYPAMKMRGDADNVMFLPEFVDSSLRIKSVRHVLVEVADAGSSSYTFLTTDFANSFSGNAIEWESNIGSEKSRRSHIALEGGHWVLRNGFGNVYDFH